jgi:hypothetical protein
MQTWVFHPKTFNKLHGKMIFNNQFKPVPSTNIFYYIWSFWKGSLVTKKLTIVVLDVFDFFLQVISPLFLSLDCLFPLQTFLQ